MKHSDKERIVFAVQAMIQSSSIIFDVANNNTEDNPDLSNILAMYVIAISKVTSGILDAVREELDVDNLMDQVNDIIKPKEEQ